jgi:hypothetical protein
MFYDLFDPSDSSDEEIKPKRKYRERKTINDFYKGEERAHFRFSRQTLEMIDAEIGHLLRPTYSNRRTDITSIHKLQIAIHFFATGDHYTTIAAANGVKKRTVSKFVHEVSRSLLSIGQKWIKFPAVEDLPAIKEGFYKVKFYIIYLNNINFIVGKTSSSRWGTRWNNDQNYETSGKN